MSTRDKQKKSRDTEHDDSVLRIALIFIFAIVLWVVVSTSIIFSAVPNTEMAFPIVIVKDIVFSVVVVILVAVRYGSSLYQVHHLRKGTEEAGKRLENTTRIFRSIMETAPDMLVFSIDKDYHFLAFNTRYQYSMLRIWGSTIDVGTSALDIIKDEAQRQKEKDEFDRVFSGEYFSTIQNYGDPNKNPIYWQRHYAPVTDDKREIIGLVCYVMNVSPLKLAQEKNLFLSYHDPLTGQYNRMFCDDAFSKANHVEELPYSIIIADVSGLKRINESFGRKTGDRILIRLGEVLAEAVKDVGTVARWGSDEFICILPRTESVNCEAIVNICKLRLASEEVDSVLLKVRFGFATKTSVSSPITSLIHEAEDMCAR